MMLETLRNKIENKEACIAVIGLGYVGLPVACMFAHVGFKAIGIDIDNKRVDTINQGENPIDGIEPGLAELISEVVEGQYLRCTTDYMELSSSDCVILAVQTPIDDNDNKPRYEHLCAALNALAPVLKPGTLIIIESTLAPGTMERTVIPILEAATDGKAGTDFYIGHCPERVMPGRLLHNIQNLDRVVGGQTPEVAQVMTELYRNIVQGQLDTTDLLTAEIVKTAENAYRDVQIAFANELARVCWELGGDVWKVRELVNKSPERNVHFPGAGVGGHCIPKDPWLLIANLNGSFRSTLIPTARAINRGMPAHIAEITEEALKEANIVLEDAVIAVLGYSYRENTDDSRDTPSAAYAALMRERGAEVRIHDQFVQGYQTDLASVLSGADAAVILVAHDLYRQQDWAQEIKLLRTPILIDTRHVLPDDLTLPEAHIRVLGRGRPTHV